MSPAIFGFVWTCFFVGALAIHRANRNADPPVKRERWIKYGVYLLTVHVFVGTALAGPACFQALAALIGILGAYEVLNVAFQNQGERKRLRPVTVFSLGLYLMLAFGLLLFSSKANSGTIVFVYLVIVALDGFSQVIGELIGSHPLAPRLSPKKTVEGACGGFAGAIVTAVALRSLADFSLTQALVAGFLLSAAGLIGDLCASYFKRLYGVKDFGRILPGHGGVLDRFDSLLAAVPVFLLWVG
jgi:phosphatidate cytidylyltransferase